MRMSLKHVLLTVLNKEPNSGYGIGRMLQQELGHVWSARLQQIYSELAKLHADGLMTVENIEFPNRPPKKIYSLTDAGRSELERWLTAGVVPHSTKDDLLVRLYSMELIPRAALIRRLQAERDAYEVEARELRSRQAQTPRANPATLGMLVTLEAARFRAESRVAWLERTLQWLRNADTAAEFPSPVESDWEGDGELRSLSA